MSEQFDEYVSTEKIRRTMASLKSEEANPELFYHNIDQCQTEFDEITRTLEATRKKYGTPKNKWKFSDAAYYSKRQSLTEFIPYKTISNLTKNRHEIELETQKAQNTLNYLKQKIFKEQKKREMEALQKSKIKLQIERNKSEKSIFEHTIKKHMEENLKRNLSSKEEVLEHRKKLHASLTGSKFSRAQAVESLKQESMIVNRKLFTMKEVEVNHKAKLFHQIKTEENSFKTNKLKRENEKLQRASENYKDKWTKEFIRGQQASIENKIRTRAIGKKIEKLLQQTEKVESKNLNCGLAKHSIK